MAWIIKTLSLLTLTFVLAWAGLVFGVLYAPDVIGDLLRWGNELPNRIEDDLQVADAYMKWVRVFVTGSPVVLLAFVLGSRTLIATTLVMTTGKLAILWRMLALYALSVAIGYALVVYLALTTDEFINTLLRAMSEVQGTLIRWSGATGYAHLLLEEVVSTHGLVVIAGYSVVRVALGLLSGLIGWTTIPVRRRA